MKKFIFLLIIFPGCVPKITDIRIRSVQEIINSDKAMSEMASKIGFNQALLNYADDDVVKPQENQFSIIGKKNLTDFWNGKIGPKSMSWIPYKADASISGDLGYSLGHWTLVLKDTSYYGDYYTIWKKQPDGKWKFVLDAGNNTPKPK